ncbi:hypothetical protein OAA10_00375 [bacterium]|nr:hypothetical protein [bacterium]
MTKDFLGMREETVMVALRGITVMSGDAAFDQIYKLMSRIGKKRWEEFEFLLGVVRFFGGRIALIHIDDMTEDEKELWGTTDAFCKRDGEVINGMYRPGDTFIELPLHRFKSWLRLEEVLRHELVHLLQHYTDPDNSCPCSRDHTHLLTDSVKHASSFAMFCRAEATDDIPAYEIEAYSIETWRNIFRDWANEIIRNESWSGKCCPVS